MEELGNPASSFIFTSYEETVEEVSKLKSGKASQKNQVFLQKLKRKT